MDLRGGPPFKQQQDFGIEGLWVPSTPAKIIPTRPFVSNPGYIQNQPSGPSLLDQVLAVSGGVQTATSPWGLAFHNGICSSTGPGDYLQDLSGSLAVAHPSSSEATIGSSFTPQAANTSYGYAGSMNCWSPQLSGKVIAAGNETALCKMIPSTPLYAQDCRYQELSSSPIQLPLNEKIMLPGDFCSIGRSKSNWPDGSTITYLPKQKLFPETMMSFAGTVSMPNLQTPTINEKYSTRLYDKQPYLDIIDIVDDDKREENLLRKEASVLQLSFEKPTETSFSNLIASSQYTSFQNPQCVHDMVFLSDKFSAQHAGVEQCLTEIENEGTDLNDASKLKSKRKKHRPKVIIEGISARTPKPATPKLKTPKSATPKLKTPKLARDTENASGKRKYTRRKIKATPSSEANTLREIADAESQSGAKSVRRCLNFDLEESPTIDNYSVLTSLFTQDLENHGQNVCLNGTLTKSILKETLDSAGVQGPVVENSLTGIIFDINSSKSQSQNEHLKVLQTPVSVIASQNFGASEKIVNSNTISNAPPKGTKRVHCLIDEAWMLNNFMHSNTVGACASKSLDAGRQGSCQDIYKRMRMEKVYNHAISDHSPKWIYTPSTGWKTIHTSNNSQAFVYDDAPKFKTQEKLHSLEGMLSFEEAYVNTNSQHIIGNNMTLSGFMGCNRNSTPLNPSIKKNKCMSQPSTHDKPSGYSNSQECTIHATVVQLETCENVNNPVKVKGRRGRKKKEQNPPANYLPMGIGISVDQCNPRVTTETTILFQGDDSHPTVNSLGCKDTSHHKATTHSTFTSGPLASYMDSLDDIVLKLRWLNISRDHEVSSSQVQNAIVPYLRDGGAMVPYQGTFDLARKLRPRAKVDLDPETNRVWKLLMGKEGEGDEGANVDKEKWWEEERRVFRGRVDSFISRMHLVQGDRRFSQWKGSVVDSVIGVFLTQNVSDHLSSSAFMALAAKFPLRSNGKYRCYNAEKVSIQPITDLPKLQRNTLDYGSCSLNTLEVNAEKNDGKMDNSCSDETLGSGTGSCSVDFCKENLLELHETEVNFGHESPNSGSGTAATVTSISSVQLEDRRLVDEAVSSQNSLVSSQNSVDHLVKSNDYPILNIDAEDLLIGSMNNGFGSSFTELMQMAERNRFQELSSHDSRRIWKVESSSSNSQVTHEIGNSVPTLNQLDNSKGTCQPYKTDSNLYHVQFGLSDMLPDLHFCHSLDLCNSTIMENNANMLKEDSITYLHSACEIQSGNKLEITYGEQSESAAENLAEFGSLIKLLSTSRYASTNDSYETIRMQNKEQIVFSNIELGTSQHSFGYITERMDATLHDDTSNLCSSVQAKDIARFQLKDGHSTSKAESSVDAVRVQNQIENFTTPKISSVSDNKMQNKLDVGMSVGSNKKDEPYKLPKISSEPPVREEKARRRRAWSEKIYEWDSLRKEVYLKKPPEERSSNTMDSLDWEAVRNADVSKIAETIRERGMNNMLAERIKDFLNRLVREHESIDLEWLRDVPSDKSKDYLLSIRGLGLKSAECVRLLTLHHLAFPVDTNVGRICVRLGWVPLQPLPESLQLHLLELYPVLETIQKYLWPRLCKLDQRTLYELHYQMITFGKVFCTKSKPNCNACPMRGDCRHFASAFASARFALPAPEDKSIVSSTYPIASENGRPPVFNQRSIHQLECSSFSQDMTVQKNCEPIIEEPATPEPECPETLESEIEEAFIEVPDEIPLIKLNLEKFTQNLQIYVQDNMELQGGDLSKALVALNPEAASIPMPKLKNVSRLRTEHQVYEIPDSHPLLELEGLDRREPDDPCPYLLAIWTPGETSQSTEPPEACCNSHDTGQLCNWSSCFVCNSIRESQAHKVRGTLLIPCRTAMRGSFPLNGTYFQVNEVFADHDSSHNPIDIPRDWIWNLPRRLVCFGTSIPTIFRGLTTEGIQQCFWKGFVCVRGFDRVTRAPKPLYARLHFPASKAPKTRKGSAAAAARVVK